MNENDLKSLISNHFETFNHALPTSKLKQKVLFSSSQMKSTKGDTIFFPKLTGLTVIKLTKWKESIFQYTGPGPQNVGQISVMQ